MDRRRGQELGVFQSTQKLFSSMSRTLPGTGSWEWRIPEDRLSWSEELLALYGVARPPRAERDFLALVHPEDRTRVEAEINAFLGAGENFAHEFRILRPDGEVRVIHDRGVIERGADGRPLRLWGLNIDVTAQRLRALEPPRDPLLELALQAAAQGAWDYDITADRVIWDDVTRALFGVPANAPLSYDFVLGNLIHPQDRALVEASARQAFDPSGEGLYQVEHRVVRPDGGVRWLAVSGRALFAGEGPARRAVRMLGTVRDVTARRENQEALLQSEERLRLASIAAGFGVYDFDPVKGCATWSPELCVLVGRDARDTEVPQAEALAQIHPEDRDAMAAKMEAFARRPGPYEMEFRIVRPDGAVRWMLDRGETFGPLDPVTGLVRRGAGTVMDITERKREEAARQESEQRLRTLFDAIDEGYCLCEMLLDAAGRPVDYRFLEVNPLFQEMTGLHGAVGRTAYGLIPDLEPYWLETYAEVALGGRALRFEQHSPVMGRWYDVFAAPVSPRGRFVIVFRDITARKRAEAALVESETRAKAIVDSISDGFISVDAAWNITYVNPSARDILRPLGKSNDDLRGKPLWQEFPGLRDTPFGEAYWRAMQEKRPLRIEEYYAPLRSWFDVRCYPVGDGISIQFRDVGERRRAEAALRQSEARFRELADAMPQLVWTADAQGRVEYYNSQVQRYIGAEKDASGRWTWQGLIHAEDSAETVAAWNEAVNSGRIYECTHRVQMADGGYRWHLSRAEPVRDARGQVVRWFGAATDIEELKRAEQHRQLLLDELNHRVKNTLAVVQSLANQTFRTDEDEDLQLAAFEGRLQALAAAHDVLTRQHWTEASLADLAEGARRAAGADRARFLAAGPPLTLAPKQALTMAMALHELATNAMKYGALSTAEGRVRLSWELTDGAAAGFLLRWREEEGPPVSPPQRQGFGTRLLRRAVAADLAGDVELNFASDGVSCVIRGRLEMGLGQT